ncbi:MAG: hypothetical protein AB1351_10540 [Thermoproteota archaeon]
MSCFLLLSPTAAFAEDGNNTAKDLGWVSIGSGVLANVPFVAYNRVKRYSVVKLGGGHEITRSMAMQHSPIMTFHMGLNLIGFAAGAVHGIIFLNRLDMFSLSLAILMTALTTSGVILRFTKSTDAKLLTRMFHGQIVLSGLLAVLIVLHVITAYED